MEYFEFEKFFSEECKKNNINVSNIKNFYEYMNLLLKWNEKVNVTAIKDEKEFIVKHFVDSLTVKSILKDSKKIIDIGTGAGFPGIPLKLVDNNLEITLVDSVNKKINVLKDIICQLKLENMEALHIRAEELARDLKYRECFDIAVSRAVSNMTTLVEYLIPFVKIGGKIICMKGPNLEDELNKSKKAIEILGGKIDSIETINISNDLQRNIVIIKKINKTPNKYPRGQGKPLKEPIA